MELAEIKILVDKYYDGETSLAEEAAIAEYFATHRDIPAELEVTRAIFMTTSTLKEISAPEVKSRRMPLGRRLMLTLGGIAAAAVVVLGVFVGVGDMSHVDDAPLPIVACYKDGVAIDNEAVVMAEAHRILGGVSEDMQIAMAKIEALNISSMY